MIWFISWNRKFQGSGLRNFERMSVRVNRFWTMSKSIKKSFFTLIPSEPVWTNVKPQDCSFPWFENKQGKDRGWHRWEENFTFNLFDDDDGGGDGDIDDHHGGVVLVEMLMTSMVVLVEMLITTMVVLVDMLMTSMVRKKTSGDLMATTLWGSNATASKLTKVRLYFKKKKF